MHRTRSHKRRGGTYVIILGSSMVVSVIGLSAIMALRVERNYANATGEYALARLYALSAIEVAFRDIADDPNWRTTRTNGAWRTNQPIGIGQYDLLAVDPDDADLANDDLGSLMLTGIGRAGAATYKLRTTLVAEVPPLTCLEVALSVGGSASFTNAIVNCDQTISANDSVTETGSSISADVEAVNLISGSGYNGSQTPGITPRSMPDPSSAFEYYTTNGTPIAISSLPTNGGVPEITKVLLSPTSNPFGATNPQGIYVIDCLGQPIQFQTCRILGTIVLLNAASSSSVLDSVHWEPALANFPALLVGGDFNFNSDSAVPLTEANPVGVNFNPAGAPYLGEEDDVLDDSYPAIIKGLIHVSGLVSTASSPVFDGVLLIGGDLNTTSSLTLTYQIGYYNNPPPGFTAPVQMVIAPGSWRRVVD